MQFSRDTIDSKTTSICKKAMLCIWWNVDGIMHFELVPNGCAISAKLYCQQLEQVYEKSKQKYPALINQKHILMQQDNAKPHPSRKTKDKFEELDSVKVLPHAAYSPDCAPSDYGLFHSMQRFLKGCRFHLICLMKSRKHVKNSLI